MNKMFLVFVSATFPITAVNAQVQVAPATGASPDASQQASPKANEPHPRRSGHGGAHGSAGVMPPGFAIAKDAKPSGTVPQGNPQRNPQ